MKINSGYCELKKGWLSPPLCFQLFGSEEEFPKNEALAPLYSSKTAEFQNICKGITDTGIWISYN
jgi:hypothetical protein